ncbi:MAG: FprA family A-type flavoprotein [Bacteroidales bacterium]|jgi:flavorubredoxin|nr:FprA family A-type flavoprotein [Bacteroidales bacterium]
MEEKILEITPHVKWIGALDPGLQVFDVVMTTEYGSTYNAYFIDAEKKTLIETVKNTHTDAYLARIKSLCNPADIAYIVLDHTEPDHSGSLSKLLDIAPNATVVGTGQAIAYLSDIMNHRFRSIKVRDGDTIELGNKTLRFIGAPNLHWPDSMYSYLVEDKVLFTCDSFGAHYCFEPVFDDLITQQDDYREAFDSYFDCILRPYSSFMLKAIEKIRPLDIRVVCPGHGPVLRSTWKEIVNRSEERAQKYMEIVENKTNKILICYVSAYGYTRLMATWIAQGIKQNSDFEVELMDIEFASLGDMEAAVTRSDALIVGSPTINKNTLLPIYKLFAAINPLRDKDKAAAAFGSYGWSGEAADIIEANLLGLKLKIVQKAVKNKFSPDKEKAQQLVEFGKSFTEQMQKEKIPVAR